MTCIQIVDIVTPRKFVLNGLLMGPERPKRIIVWVHGMFASVFSMRHVVERLIDDETAVLTFNNRGYQSVSSVKQYAKIKPKSVRAGTAHEVFTDCEDDIEGAVRFAKKTGAKEIYVAGHSTGCQKAVYWAYKKNPTIRGIILLAPMSDYASIQKHNHYRAALRSAKALIQAGKPHVLLSDDAWNHDVDAQRFISLYTPDSIEQSIFPYFDAARRASTFARVRLPTLVILAEDDEYADRPMQRVAEWFGNARKNTHVSMLVKATHNFKGAERELAKTITNWISLKK